MDRVRIVIGFVLGVFFIGGGFLHAIPGWKTISGQLAESKAPQDLISNLALGWHFGSAAMWALGCIVLFVFTTFSHDRSSSLRIAQLVGIFYAAFGAWAYVESRLVFFVLMFVVPGVLLLAASTRSSRVAQA